MSERDNTLAANALLATGKVKQIHKCPTCGARINTNKCIGCFIEERKRKGFYNEARTSTKMQDL
jgi:hypothetical protein